MQVLITGGAGFIGSFVVDRLLAAGHAVRVLDNLHPQVHPDGPPAYLSPDAELPGRRARPRPARPHDRGRRRSRPRGGGSWRRTVPLPGRALRRRQRPRHRDPARLPAAPRQPSAEAPRVHLDDRLRRGLYAAVRRRLLRVELRSEEDIARHGWEPVCPETGEALEPRRRPRTPRCWRATSTPHQALAGGAGAGLGRHLRLPGRLPAAVQRLRSAAVAEQSLHRGARDLPLPAAGRRAPVVYEDGGQTSDFVSVHDVADTPLRVLEIDGRRRTGDEYRQRRARRIADIGRALATLTGREDLPPRVTGQFRRGDVRHCTADVSRARRCLGFVPRVAWEDGLRELLALVPRRRLGRPLRPGAARAREPGAAQRRSSRRPAGSGPHEAGAGHRQQRAHRLGGRGVLRSPRVGGPRRRQQHAPRLLRPRRRHELEPRPPARRHQALHAPRARHPRARGDGRPGRHDSAPSSSSTRRPAVARSRQGPPVRRLRRQRRRHAESPGGRAPHLSRSRPSSS